MGTQGSPMPAGAEGQPSQSDPTKKPMQPKPQPTTHRFEKEKSPRLPTWPPDCPDPNLMPEFMVCQSHPDGTRGIVDATLLLSKIYNYYLFFVFVFFAKSIMFHGSYFFA